MKKDKFIKLFVLEILNNLIVALCMVFIFIYIYYPNQNLFKVLIIITILFTKILHSNLLEKYFKEKYTKIEENKNDNTQEFDKIFRDGL